MKEIKLTQGKFTQVDDEDYEYLNHFNWHVLKMGVNHYAYRNGSVKNERYTISMHKQLMNTPENMVIDHIDHNGLNNQRSNLRICTSSQNLFNRMKKKGKSKYLGVTHNLSKQKYTSKKSGETYIIELFRYVSKIKVNGKSKYLGSYLNEIDAANAYNIAAKKYHGEFANFNIL